MNEEMRQSLTVHGRSVYCNDRSRIGVDYLYGLSYEEAVKLFNQAGSSGSVNFTDNNSYGYKLIYNSSGIYTLERKY